MWLGLSIWTTQIERKNLGLLDQEIKGRVHPIDVATCAVLAAFRLKSLSEPLTDPWTGRMDGSLSRRLGFQPTVPTVYQAAQQGIL
jgi:hypothetical protein